MGVDVFSGCTALKNITLSNNVKNIGKAAFQGCVELNNIVIPNSVKNIGNNAFYGCKSLTNITIPGSVTSIGSRAFTECINLKNITISNGVTYIGSEAFYGCSGLKNIVIPSSVKSIGDYAFCNCSLLRTIEVDQSNNNYTSVVGVLFDKNQTELICCPTRIGSSYIIPDGVKRIRNYAFYGCAGLVSVVIPDSVTEIGEDAFSGCSSSLSIYYGDVDSDTGTSQEAPVVEITPSETDTEYIFTVTPIEVNQNCRIYGAAYDVNGILLDCNSKELETEGTTVSVKKADRVKTVKVFVWTDKMQPVAIEEIKVK